MRFETINPASVVTNGTLIVEGSIGRLIDECVDTTKDIAKALRCFVDAVTLKFNEFDIPIMRDGIVLRDSEIYKEYYRLIKQQGSGIQEAKKT